MYQYCVRFRKRILGRQRTYGMLGYEPCELRILFKLGGDCVLFRVEVFVVPRQIKSPLRG